ncbi:hypothetical protein SK803_06700 [Lentzea sp. BCCO 10_0856]|uniref:Repeat domain-containing protein n=1 Tax=Lentzea miocenica TaxID=3095431 RepID=A0ABU4SVG1_9PSEU|nr:hypothetical protein [Lentzea sp. BCCO 10_0856]MDX8029894.1 hypothetical protein [Lentzea sp. BCCO 10_0856]
MRRRTWIAAAVVALSVTGLAVPATAEPGTSPRPSGDVTGDGKSDITARTSDGRLVVYPQIDGGNFGAPVTIGYGWRDVNYHWIATARADGAGPSDVVAADLDGNLWLYPNAGFNGISTLRQREIAGKNFWYWADGWGKAVIRTVRGDGLDDIEKIYASDNETSIYHFQNKLVYGVDHFEQFSIDRESKGRVVWTQYSEVPGSVTRGQYRDRIVEYANGRLAVQKLEFENSVGRYREITLGWGWDTLDSLMLKEISGDGIPDLLGRRKSDGALVAYLHSGRFDESDVYNTYLAPRVLSTGWYTVDQIS